MIEVKFTRIQESILTRYFDLYPKLWSAVLEEYLIRIQTGQLNDSLCRKLRELEPLIYTINLREYKEECLELPTLFRLGLIREFHRYLNNKKLSHKKKLVLGEKAYPRNRLICEKDSLTSVKQDYLIGIPSGGDRNRGGLYQIYCPGIGEKWQGFNLNRKKLVNIEISRKKEKYFLDYTINKTSHLPQVPLSSYQ